MPIVAVAGAALAIGIAAPAATALFAGLTISLTGALTIVGAVGATLGAIGAVTRDKGLQMAGMIIGGIAAVGGIANSLGAFGDTSSLFGTAASGAAGEGTAAVGGAGQVTSLANDSAIVDTSSLTVPKDFIDTLNEATGIPENVGQAAATEAVSINQLGEVTTNVPGAASIAETADETSPELEKALNYVPGETDVAENLTGNLAKDAVTNKGLDAGIVGTSQDKDLEDALTYGDVLKRTGAPLDPSAVSKGFQAPSPTPANLLNPSAKTVGIGGTTVDTTGIDAANESIVNKDILDIGSGPPGGGIKGALTGILNFADKHPIVTLGLVQVAGHFLEGYSSLTKAQVAAYQAQAAANQANTAETNQKVANMQGGMPIAKLNPVRPAPITGKPAPGASAPAAPGLINQAPQVTGVAA